MAYRGLTNLIQFATSDESIMFGNICVWLSFKRLEKVCRRIGFSYKNALNPTPMNINDQKFISMFCSRNLLPQLMPPSAASDALSSIVLHVDHTLL